MLKKLFNQESKRRASMVKGQVVADPTRCVQCGICSFNCPVEIDVRTSRGFGSCTRRNIPFGVIQTSSGILSFF